MSGRVLSFGKPAHHGVESLLPWYVNGTLDEAERGQVEKHLQECNPCRQEVEWLREVHACCADADSAAACEQSWRVLRARLAARRAPWRRLLARLGRLPLVPRMQAWAPWVAVFELVLLVVAGGALLATADRVGRYRTLAEDGGAAAPARLVVIFDPHSTGAETTRILRRAGARIVDGPTAADAFVVSIPAERLERGLQELRAERAVVLVEPLELQRGQ